MSEVNLFDVIIVSLYLVSILIVTAYMSKRVKERGIEEFAVGSKSLKMFPLICSVAGSHIGSGLSLGLVGMMYGDGIQAIWIAIGYFAGTVIYTLVIIGRARRKAEKSGWGITLGDVIEDTMGKKGRLIFGTIASWERVAVTSGQLVAAGVLVATIFGQFGINLTTAIIIVGIIIIINVGMGGLSAVVWADVIQMIIMTIGIGILLPVILGSQLDFSQLFSSADKSFYNIAPTNMAILGTAVAWFTSGLANQTVWSRGIAAKDEKTAIKSNIIGSSIGIAWGVLMVFITFSMKAIYPNIGGNPDSFLVNTIVDGFPIVITGLILAAVLANILSTTNTVLLQAVMNITHDLYSKVFKQNATEEEKLKFARIITPIVGILPTLLGLYIPQIIEVQNLGYNFYGAAVTIPFWISMLFPRIITPIGGISSMVTGAAVSIFFYFTDITTIPNSLLGIIASGITLLVVSQITKNNKNIDSIEKSS